MRDPLGELLLEGRGRGLDAGSHTRSARGVSGVMPACMYRGGDTHDTQTWARLDACVSELDKHINFQTISAAVHNSPVAVRNYRSPPRGKWKCTLPNAREMEMHGPRRLHDTGNIIKCCVRRAAALCDTGNVIKCCLQRPATLHDTGNIIKCCVQRRATLRDTGNIIKCCLQLRLAVFSEL